MCMKNTGTKHPMCLCCCINKQVGRYRGEEKVQCLVVLILPLVRLLLHVGILRFSTFDAAWSSLYQFLSCFGISILYRHVNVFPYLNCPASSALLVTPDIIILRS